MTLGNVSVGCKLIDCLSKERIAVQQVLRFLTRQWWGGIVGVVATTLLLLRQNARRNGSGNDGTTKGHVDGSTGRKKEEAHLDFWVVCVVLPFGNNMNERGQYAGLSCVTHTADEI